MKLYLRKDDAVRSSCCANKLIHGSRIYRDARLSGYDAAAVVEVIEHLDPFWLASFERVLFEFAQPSLVALTTPNREYNVMWPSLPVGAMRHRWGCHNDAPSLVLYLGMGTPNHRDLTNERRKRTMNTTKSSSTRVVIVGGGYAGVMAALRLAGQSRGARVHIQLINGAATFNERIRLHQIASGQTLPVYNLHSLLNGSGVDFRQGWVTAINAHRQTLTVQDDAGEETVTYDYLIYAVGSQVDQAMLPGGAEHALSLTHPTQAEEIQRRLDALNQGEGTLLIIGGGLTGIELVTEVAEAYPHINVTLSTRGTFGHSLSVQGADYVHGVFRELGIHLRQQVDVLRLAPGKAYTRSGEEIPFDVCLWAGAFRVSPLAQQSGLPVDTQGRVLVDTSLRSVAFPNIYAVGDAASTPLRMACATALPMGAYAGGHLAAQLSERPLPGAFSFAYLLQCVSLGRHRGLVQFVDSHDYPRRHILTGRIAAFVKEFICRYTVWSLQLEKRLPGSYQWPQAPLSLPGVVSHPAEAARTIQ